jgi:L-lactate transport
MWTHNYIPLAGSLALSALVAALPIFTLLFLLGVRRQSAWVAALCGLAAATLIAIVEYGMPFRALVGAISYGAAYGLFPIGWIIFGAIFLYRLTVTGGCFEIIKDSIGSVTNDARMQVLLVAFAFGAFIEGCSGFGTPIAIAAAMLAGLGFSSFYAASICLVANTAPVAFGAIGIPIVVLSGITGLPLFHLSAIVGRICAPVSLLIPTYLILVMGGWKALKGVLPAVVVCGLVFASIQFTVSNLVGPQLTDILASTATLGALVLLSKVWAPSDSFTLAGETEVGRQPAPPRHSGLELARAWCPYVMLVVFVLCWGVSYIQPWLNSVNVAFNWPWLHNSIQRVPPVVSKPSAYAASFSLNWLSNAGSACFLAGIASAILLGMRPKTVVKVFAATARQLVMAELTMAAVLAIAFLMNYSGATGTLGLAFAATGASFPFFSAMLGWLGVFLTGSDASANALFGNLQVVTANKLGMNPFLMAAANSAGGVMGKMISLASIAVASTATNMKHGEEARLFRFSIRHSLLLAVVVGLIVLFFSYVAPRWVS